MLRRVILDGTNAAYTALADALGDALNGGPAVLPLDRGIDPGALPGTDPGTALVIRTSGSSGRPKLVQLPAGALRASVRASAERLGGSGSWLLALPVSHIAGAQVILRALLSGGALERQELAGGFRPDAFAAATARLPDGAPRFTSLVPTQLHRLLSAGGPGLEALRTYRAVLVGGAALPEGLRARARAAGVAVVTTYGMSETAGGCVYDGVPLSGVRVELEPDGTIRLGGPMLATGYLTDPAETAAAFTEGSFRTADVGAWRDGRLRVLGRRDEMINTGGEKVAPGAVEQALLGLPGVRAACAVGLPDPEWGQIVAAAIVLDKATPFDAAGLRAAVAARLGRAAAPRRLLTVAGLPELGIGKPDRAAVAGLFDPARPIP